MARAEAEHFIALLEDEPIGVQIGIVPDTLPHASFQIFRQPDRHILALSPFRLGEEPNIRVGVAMITSAPEALTLHEKMAKELWALAGTIDPDRWRVRVRQAVAVRDVAGLVKFAIQKNLTSK
jgi:hypothetical protein